MRRAFEKENVLRCSKLFLLAVIAIGFSSFVWSSTTSEISANIPPLDLTNHTLGYFCLGIFVVAYALVICEEYILLPKSKPVLLAAGTIWITVASVYADHNLPGVAEAAIRHNILEFSELFLFLLVAMTYINSMEERLVFEALRSWLVRSGLSFRKLYWLTGLLTFFISPIADNLTTALLMCAVLISVGKNNAKFVSVGCINVVVAANAGGAFSPFGDITTLMIWQKGIVEFWTFFSLFVPSLVNWFVPAMIMQFTISHDKPKSSTRKVIMKRGAKRVVLLFLSTIVTAVYFHNNLHLPPVAGMMMGLSYLGVLGFYLRRTFNPERALRRRKRANTDLTMGDIVPFDTFKNVARSEWDTLLFFYGVILCVGGLGFMGYFTNISKFLYLDLGPTTANIYVGVLSAIVDNIPVMFAVLTMSPDMSFGAMVVGDVNCRGGGKFTFHRVCSRRCRNGAGERYIHLFWSP